MKYYWSIALTTAFIFVTWNQFVPYSIYAVVLITALFLIQRVTSEDQATTLKKKFKCLTETQMQKSFEDWQINECRVVQTKSTTMASSQLGKNATVTVFGNLQIKSDFLPQVFVQTSNVFLTRICQFFRRFVGVCACSVLLVAFSWPTYSAQDENRTQEQQHSSNPAQKKTGSKNVSEIALFLNVM